MKRLYVWLRRLAGLVHRERWDRQLEDELESHVQMHMDDNRRLGMTEREARRHALIRLGGLEQIKEQYRDRRGVPALEILLDLRFAVRTMRRSPGFSLLVVCTLAIGIGATTAIFSVVQSVLLRPLPFPESDRLVMIWERPPHRDHRNPVSMTNFVAWRERGRSFDTMAAFQRTSINLIGGDEPVQVTGAMVTADFFRVLASAPALGRAFRPNEDAPTAPATIVLSHGFWLRHFGGRADVIGRRISANVTHHEIIGVMPPGFAFPDRRVEVFIPLRARAVEGRNHSVIARLLPGVSAATAQHEMAAIAAATADERPSMNADWSATVVPLHEQIVGQVRRPLLVLFGAVGFVLLIACTNVANLLLMRSTEHAREMTIRLALGAGRWRLLHQVLIESLVFAIAGASFGLALSWLGIEALVRMLPRSLSMPRIHEVSIDSSVLLFAAGATVVTAIAFGVAPQLVTRRSWGRPIPGASRSITSGYRHVQGLMVVAEVALALPVLAGAGLMLHSFLRLNDVEPGFRAENVLTVRMLLLPVRDRAFHAEFVNDVLERVRRVPQVVAAGSIGRLPMEGGNSGSWYYRADGPEPSPSERPSGDISIITPGYFQAMGIPIVKGRDFLSSDRIGSPHVAILNQTAAHAFFKEDDPLGRRLKVSWNDAREVEVIGIAADIRHSQLHTPPDPCLFLTNTQQPFPFSALVIRTAGNPAALVSAVKTQIRDVDPDQGVGEIHTMKDIVADALAPSRMQAQLLGLFAAVALSLTSIGIYGVLGYSVAQRTREIGVRLALGAPPSSAFRLVLDDGFRLTAIGLAIGLGAAVVLTRAMRGLLYEVEPLDPVVFAGVTVLVSLVAATACAIPAVRATRVDPAIVLRDE